MIRLGVELGAHAVRGVRVDGWPKSKTRAVDIESDLDRPDDAVRLLQEHLGTPRRIAIAVDLPLLLARRIRLPALSATERRQIIRLEPERFFAVRGEELIPAVREDDLVFAGREDLLGKWISALERIAPVDVVEPAPVSLARALSLSIDDAVVLEDRGTDGVCFLEIRGGRVSAARRLFGTIDDVADQLSALDSFGASAGPVYIDGWSDERLTNLTTRLPSITPMPLPSTGGVAPAFLAAYGVARQLTDGREHSSTLVPLSHARSIQRRRRREAAQAVVVFVACLTLALISFDASRERAARELDAELITLRQRAAPALALESRLQSLARRSETIRSIEAERNAPLEVLRALSRALPAGAFIQGVSVTGSQWQIEGYAPNATSVLAALGSKNEFRDVHFASAMNRAQIGSETYESFALAFRHGSPP